MQGMGWDGNGIGKSRAFPVGSMGSMSLGWNVEFEVGHERNAQV